MEIPEIGPTSSRNDSDRRRDGVAEDGFRRRRGMRGTPCIEKPEPIRWVFDARPPTDDGAIEPEAPLIEFEFRKATKDEEVEPYEPVEWITSEAPRVAEWLENRVTAALAVTEARDVAAFVGDWPEGPRSARKSAKRDPLDDITLGREVHGRGPRASWAI